MTLTPKENSLLSDLKSQEQLCAEKYFKYSAEAHDPRLRNIFGAIGQIERNHLETLGQISNGVVPNVSSGSEPSIPPAEVSSCSGADKNADKYLCSDALATEKHASSLYDTCIFEFSDSGVRNVLNHIQKEEQEHGKHIYDYMSQNGMY